MILRIEMYFPFLTELETRIFLVYSSLLITSSTVVFLILVAFLSTVKGVYPVIKKWHLGVGIKLATNPIKSLFMYPGYLKVVVEADMMVETIELICAIVGFYSFNLSVAILYRALLSMITLASAFNTSLFRVKRQL